MARSAPRSRAPLAPGASSPPARPRRLPSIDDRLAPPETRVEYIDGVEYFAAPADPPHALAHGDLAFVLRAHTAPGYRFAVDMLTRTDRASDFAPDASIFPEGDDPKTGRRRLEELAFEVVSKQALKVPTLKARKLVARGVRRMFAILVGKKRVLEWSRETDGWQPLDVQAVIDDRCLVRPLPIRALFEATEGDEAVVAALRDRKVPALMAALADERRQGEARGEASREARGEAKGLRAGIADLCEILDIPLSSARRARLEAMGVPELEALRQALKRTRRWPAAPASPPRAAPRRSPRRGGAKSR
ncbi:MAG TPA: Uma2 family endonuclease [Polyangiaceae bacterium]|nr:Uma2 family endonuclease [Polyangiaceae bacterium]